MGPAIGLRSAFVDSATANDWVGSFAPRLLGREALQGHVVQSTDSPSRIVLSEVAEGRVMESEGSVGLFAALPAQAAPERVGGGAPRLRHAERGQIEWRPFSLDQLVPEEHRVRLVWQFVTEFDLTPLLGAIKAVEGHAGYPSADPRILVALWLYATVKKIGSAR